MNNSPLAAIEHILHLIETRLTDKINLDELARHAYLSKFHMHRMVSHAVGMPLMNYIRARKLSASLDLLRDGRHSVLSVSAHFAFEHEQSYIRAFKKQFGLTPARFRAELPKLTVTEKADLAHLRPFEGGVLFQPTIVFHPAMELVGVKHRIGTEDNLRQSTANHAAVDFFYHYRPLITDVVHDRVYIGLTRYESWEEESYTYYYPSAQVSSLANVPPGMETNVLAAGKYAVFKYVCGFHPSHITIRHLEQIWDYMQSYFRYTNPSFYHGQPYHFEYVDESIATEQYGEISRFRA